MAESFEGERIVTIRRPALLLVLFFMPAAFGLLDEAVGRVIDVISGDSLGIKMLIADARANNIDSIKLADIEVPSTVTLEGKAAQNTPSLCSRTRWYIWISMAISPAHVTSGASLSVSFTLCIRNFGRSGGPLTESLRTPVMSG